MFLMRGYRRAHPIGGKRADRRISRDSRSQRSSRSATDVSEGERTERRLFLHVAARVSQTHGVHIFHLCAVLPIPKLQILPICG
jgi:hypothetical protein